MRSNQKQMPVAQGCQFREVGMGRDSLHVRRAHLRKKNPTDKSDKSSQSATERRPGESADRRTKRRTSSMPAKLKPGLY